MQSLVKIEDNNWKLFQSWLYIMSYESMYILVQLKNVGTCQ